MASNIGRILHYIGNLLAIAGIVFVGIRLRGYWGQIDFTAVDAVFSLVLGVAVCAYGAANILLALAWRDILAYLGVTTSTAWAVRIYGLSQLAKYVPGNIMHLAGRQAMAQAEGVPGWTLAKSTVWELGLLTFTGSLFTLLLLPRFFSLFTPGITIVLFCLIVGFTVLGIRQLFSGLLALAFGNQFCFLFFSGGIFFVLLQHVTSKIHISIFTIFFYCGSFVIAWLAGMITPGAPAGLGVREFVLTVLLHNFITEADLLLAVLLSRMVTAVGDMLFFLVVSIFLPKIKMDLGQKL